MYGPTPGGVLPFLSKLMHCTYIHNERSHDPMGFPLYVRSAVASPKTLCINGQDTFQLLHFSLICLSPVSWTVNLRSEVIQEPVLS
jgi:hypothetical protein